MKSIQEIIGERNPAALIKIDELLSKNGESLEEVLIKSRVLDEKEVLEVLSEFYEFPYTLTISEREIDTELVKVERRGHDYNYLSVLPLKRYKPEFFCEAYRQRLYELSVYFPLGYCESIWEFIELGEHLQDFLLVEDSRLD